MNERGSVTVLAATLVVVAGLLLAGIARLGAATVLQARADAAADSAALAAADALALGRSSDDAETAARATAVANGAHLVTCDCADRHAEVTVEVETAGVLGHLGRAVVGRARAEVAIDDDFVPRISAFGPP